MTLRGPSQASHVGIRPEHLDIAARGAGDVDAEVLLVERLGSDTNVYTSVEQVGPILARLNGNVALQSGEPIALRFDPGHMHFFAQSDRALV